MPPSFYVELALCADDMAFAAKSRKSSLLVYCLMASQQTSGLATGLEDCYQRLKNNRGALVGDCETHPKAHTSPVFRRDNTADMNSTVPWGIVDDQRTWKSTPTG
jgi:hypothetical protein